MAKNIQKNTYTWLKIYKKVLSPKDQTVGHDFPFP